MTKPLPISNIWISYKDVRTRFKHMSWSMPGYNHSKDGPDILDVLTDIWRNARSDLEYNGRYNGHRARVYSDPPWTENIMKGIINNDYQQEEGCNPAGLQPDEPQDSTTQTVVDIVATRHKCVL